MTRGGQPKSSAVERHEQVFDRKSNAFRKGTAQLGPPPAAGDDGTAMPRKLRMALALSQAGSLAARGGVRPKPPPRRAPPPAAPKPVAATPRPGAAAADTATTPVSSSGGGGGGAGGGGGKRKVKHEGAKAKRRKKRLERERAAAEEAAEQQPRDRPRFGEVADAPPAVALQRKHGLGQLFAKQLASAASGTREREQLRAGAVEHYRKLRGRVALPYLAAMREHAEQRGL